MLSNKNLGFNLSSPKGMNSVFTWSVSPIESAVTIAYDV